MNPYIDWKGAAFGGAIMAATLVTLLAINAASQNGNDLPVAYVTAPAAFVMLCWDIGFGWINRHETRQIARKGREDVERARAERAMREEEELRQGAISKADSPTRADFSGDKEIGSAGVLRSPAATGDAEKAGDGAFEQSVSTVESKETNLQNSPSGSVLISSNEKHDANLTEEPKLLGPGLGSGGNEEVTVNRRPRATLVSLVADAYRWSQETFPTVTAVLAHLPFALVPFAFAMFVLVQGLVTKGWVQVFAHGWDHWVNKTGTVGAVGGMAFLSVILCNFSGTNIGTTILLSRVIQTWVRIHEADGTFISDRTFWATVYSMALGVNYGAFSTAFSASLAGLLWRDILARKHIHVRRLDFARVNLPIITIAMIVGCAVLVGEVYIVRKDNGYVPSWGA